MESSEVRIIAGDLGRGSLLSYFDLTWIALLMLMEDSCNLVVTLYDEEQCFIQYNLKH